MYYVVSIDVSNYYFICKCNAEDNVYYLFMRNKLCNPVMVGEKPVTALKQ